MKNHSRNSSQQHRALKESNGKPGSVWHKWFRTFAHQAAEWMGCAWTFCAALLLIFIWALTGPIFQFSDSWQLVVNTATTIITFLMVFLIQNTQNRDAKALHLKLDELLHCIKGARNSLVGLEELSDEELARLQKQFERIRKRANEESEMKNSDETVAEESKA
jgi:low affinity Fe/Cu permease